MTSSISTLTKALPPETIEFGKVLKRRVSGDSVLKYFIYVPKNRSTCPSQFVSVHGISRNAREHAERFASLAEQYGVVLVAPIFSRRHFGDYQRLGREGRGRRADHALQSITEEVEYLTGANSRKIFLTGFSGGGQFAHRYTLAYPDRVQRLAIGAAGWYSYPDESRRFPYGIAPAPGLKGVDFDMRKFLHVPTAVFVGQWDIMYDPGLNQSSKICRQQGFTRLERGRRWVDAMNRVAMKYNMDTSYEFAIIPGVGHDFNRAMENGQLGRHIFNYLFSILTDRYLPDRACPAGDKHRFGSDWKPPITGLPTEFFP
ncbi:MAG TPA: hypothetical protein ENI68_08150 [Gammaproteobacteria bacterium]|nr:hypothetical protein [Gammaproteobacteria bacterium]